MGVVRRTYKLSESLSSVNEFKDKFDFFADQSKVATGNIFKNRTDLSAFSSLSICKQNPYNIKLEDDGPFGNDDTRNYVLTNLSLNGVTSMHCCTCEKILTIYDCYPLIDGLFYLSSVKHSKNAISVTFESCTLFMNSICYWCLTNSRLLKCLSCKQIWPGDKYMIGSLYVYDIFSALPCCLERLRCKNCHWQISDNLNNYFCWYSKKITCEQCKESGFHFQHELRDIFMIHSEF